MNEKEQMLFEAYIANWVRVYLSAIAARAVLHPNWHKEYLKHPNPDAKVNKPRIGLLDDFGKMKWPKKEGDK